jgi:N-acetylglutamate synthase-like GNAT family acetyltransferase
MASISTSNDIEIIPLLPEHRQSVINLLMSSFFIQEPLNAMLKFDIPHEILIWIDHLVDESLHDQCSFVAIDKTSLYKNVVGFILNGISTRTYNEEIFIVESEKLNFIFSLIDKLSIGYDLFELYKTDRLFRCDIINVDESQRRQNLSARLISASLDKAHELGIKGVYVVCSSLYSKKAFERQGFQVINEILYSEHGNGRLTDMGEHDRCSLLVKQL